MAGRPSEAVRRPCSGLSGPGDATAAGFGALAARLEVGAWPALGLEAAGGIPDVAGLPRSAIRHADGRLYLERFEVAASPAVTVRVHRWHASDDQRAPHDHPWPNVSIVLAGELIEHGRAGPARLTPGTIVSRAAADPHWIELPAGEAWTVFVTGPIVRRWGFHTAGGWIHWTEWPNAGTYE